MNINFHYDGVTASNRLEILVAKKIDKLLNKYDFIVSADIFFKKENTSSPETGKVIGVRLSAPGPRLFSESSEASYEAAITSSVDDLSRQLEKRKAKMKTY
ncbi:MAG: HPF/RaiA family ribosome-associated protein [Cellulophaga sp.]|uniref:HPF/RaiA family ribosome-associated protein n=1 Tax=unclassified Cellulophaga TaxID=2634405 RepID=UPI000C2CAB58|nr:MULTISPECIES: HPF/RaiA family ribosome-associated protein [unclassified Cellulophaga]MDO6492551.1 HPF/RaiA family ribosome-associated protein [Cellulophaga sp. 2_MG-2023]MDO6493653.1 HPF/RaiA family ribosome-associated protein [Cellulophaga sp. 3_MG-2023]PKB44361.1 putative sigma-54 modulation protein [Cellulophaga sp. RHA19]